MMTFEQLYVSCHMLIYRYLRSLGCPHELAEDITQESFAALLSKYDEISEYNVKAYIYKTALNKYRNHLKIAGREETLNELSDINENNIDNMEELIIEDIYKQMFYQCLHKLSYPYKEVMSFWLSGKTHYEIAKEMKRSVSWSRITLHRAKMKVKEMLENEKM
ncbi:MAG: sigma-70 family RNA polymerase sigma factor [Clostridia bacterium]|nr:sigma-70 family RNA polymerase sigma factor [Clostridia bacterium]